MTSSENRGWVGAHKKMMAVLGTATALLGAATGALTLRGHGATATGDKSVVLAASFAGNADDPAGKLMQPVQACLPFSLFDSEGGCPVNRLAPLREGMHVTSMTVGDISALEALEAAGALFFPDPDTAS